MVFCRDMAREVEDEVDARDVLEVAGGCCSIVLVVIWSCRTTTKPLLE